MMAAQREAGLVAKGTLRRGSRQDPRAPDAPITLAEAGIDKHLAHRARQMATVPDAEEFGEIQESRDSLEPQLEALGYHRRQRRHEDQ